MLNKQTKVLAIVLAVLLSGVIGFALFSQQLEIKGTAKAEGKFEVTPTCTKGLATGFTVEDGNNIIADNHFNEEIDSCTVNGNTVTYNVELLQPGASRNYTIKMTNTGTIDAKLAIDQLSDNGEKTSCWADSNGELTDCYEEAHISNDLNGGLETIGLSNGTNTYKVSTDMEEIMSFFDETGEYIILKPGESIILLAKTNWDIDYTRNPMFYRETMKITLNFTQAN